MTSPVGHLNIAGRYPVGAGAAVRDVNRGEAIGRGDLTTSQMDYVALPCHHGAGPVVYLEPPVVGGGDGVVVGPDHEVGVSRLSDAQAAVLLDELADKERRHLDTQAFWWVLTGEDNPRRWIQGWRRGIGPCGHDAYGPGQLESGRFESLIELGWISRVE